MYNRLISFLDKHNVLFDKQFGFRSKHNTDHAILSIVDKIQKAIEERNYSCGIFLDFSKAFDTVNHKILLSKCDNVLIYICSAREFHCRNVHERVIASISMS